jgi:hypothetical protein
MKLSISSWLSCSPTSSVLRFVNQTDFVPSGKFPAEITDQFGRGIRADHSGVPDIHTGSEKWLSRVKQIGAERRLILTGQRIDFDFDRKESGRLDAMVKRSGHSEHSPYG